MCVTRIASLWHNWEDVQLCFRTERVLVCVYFNCRKHKTGSTQWSDSKSADRFVQFDANFFSISIILRCKCSNSSLEQITKPEECWCCTDIDRCTERMYEVEKEGQCITEHPGYAACCLNSWVLSTAAIGLKTRAKKSYATTKTEKNVAEPG